MKTKIINIENGIRLEIKITADKNGMVDLGNNTFIPLKILTEYIREHGLSYVQLPQELSAWTDTPPHKGR